MAKSDAVTVEWGTAPEESIAVHSVEELDALLDQLDSLGRATDPFLTTIMDAAGRTLTIGLGGLESVAQFCDDADDGLSYASVPDPARTGAKLVFALEGMPNEMLAELGTPNDAARTAARHFFAHGERCPTLRWESS
jgi:hypothetical protein